ncbi:unnamed protein product [Leptosia nina]|uniref:Uncharacterized protein n=1 Tax=Leptosia nina TaxID=320188 RepID=A0AAV1J3L1_9NEOP
MIYVSLMFTIRRKLATGETGEEGGGERGLAACCIAGAAIRRDEYVRSHSSAGRGAATRQDVARRPTPDDIDFVPPPAAPHAPALSIRPRVLSSRAYGHLRQKLRLNDMTPQLKMPTGRQRAASRRRALMNPATESHSVEIATAPPRCPRPRRWKK